MTTPTLSHFEADFDTALSNFMRGKKKVSPWLHTFLQLLVFLFTSCAVAMAASYAVQLGETPTFKGVIIATAVGIECAIVFFSAVIYPKWFLVVNQFVAGVLLPILSLFTIMSFMVSQQFAADHKVEEMGKQYIQSLQEDAGKLSAANKADRGSLQATRDRIEGMFQRLEGSKGSKATAVYHYIGKLTGWDVETIVLLVRALWSLCFVSLCIALDSFVDLRLYSPNQLNKFISEWKGEKETIEKARASVLGGAKVSSGVVRSGDVSESPASPRPVRSSVLRGPRGEAYDTGTNGDNASRYERIKAGVEEGKIKASVRGLKAEGMSQMTAEKYLKRLQDEGVGYVNGVA
jgi:hypothetical protein